MIERRQLIEPASAGRNQRSTPQSLHTPEMISTITAGSSLAGGGSIIKRWPPVD
jgi:hypothetical protein